MENESFIQRVQSSPGYQGSADVRQIADPILEQVRNLSRLPHAPAAEKKELHRLLGTLQQKLSGVLTAPSAKPSASSASIEKAKEMMNGCFFGIEEVKKAFGIELKETDIPALPPMEEVERHAKLGHTLRLRVNKAPDGKPLTMQKMNELLSEAFEAEGDKVLYDTDWYENEDFYTKEAPALCWAFTSDTLLPESTEKNYLEQTQLLADYVTTTLFAGKPVPPAYQEAVDEFKKLKKNIEKLMSSNWQEAAKQLSVLKLNRLMRHTPAEALYDYLQTYRNKGERILEDNYTWTPVLSSDGNLVYVGFCDSDGAGVHNDLPGDTDGALGVSLSRRFP